MSSPVSRSVDPVGGEGAGEELGPRVRAGRRPGRGDEHAGHGRSAAAGGRAACARTPTAGPSPRRARSRRASGSRPSSRVRSAWSIGFEGADRRRRRRRRPSVVSSAWPVRPAPDPHHLDAGVHLDARGWRAARPAAAPARSAGCGPPSASTTCQRPKVRSTLSRTACQPGSRRGSWPSRAATSSTTSVSWAAGRPAASRARLSRGRSLARTSAVSCSRPVNSRLEAEAAQHLPGVVEAVEQVAPGDRSRLAEGVAERRPLLAPVGGQVEAGAVGEAVAAGGAGTSASPRAVELRVERPCRTCGTGRARPRAG